jgi:hypothetical protein
MSTAPSQPLGPRKPVSGPPSHAAWKIDAVTAIVHGSLERLLDLVPEVEDPLGAELLGSDVSGIWWAPGDERDVPIEESERLVARSYAAHLEELDDDRALGALRVLQVGAGGGWTAEVAPVADRLTGRGRREPAWWPGARARRPYRGGQLRWLGDGREFDLHLLQTTDPFGGITLAAVADRGAGGVVADVLLVTEINGLLEYLETYGDAPGEIDWASAARAGARVRDAIARTDLVGVGTPPPGSEPEAGYAALRGVLLRWADLAVDASR